MQVSKITNNYHSVGSNFKGLQNRKAAYKHYHELNDNELMMRSMYVASKDIMKSGKNKVLKALPAITAGLMAASLAITQPGKLSSKIVTGLGFLAIHAGLNVLDDKFDEKFLNNGGLTREQQTKNVIKSIAMVGGIMLAGFGLIKANPKVNKFLSSEFQQFATEVDGSKFGQKISNNINNFFAKHSKIGSLAGFVLPTATVVGHVALENKLNKDLNLEFKNRIALNFAKGKYAQHIARQHFDSIDAKEI